MSRQDRLALVALVGRPNVGKSSLFNRLTRKRDAIVDATPGVTRDRHYQKIDWEGHEFILIDTGGIEPPPSGVGGKAFPKEADVDSRGEVINGIQEQTWLAVQEADLVVLMLDGRQGISGEDYRVAEIMRKSGKPVLFVVNKVDGQDLENKLVPQFFELGAEQLWPVSAAHGYGVVTLMTELTSRLPVFTSEGPAVDEETVAVACIGRPNVGKSSLINKLLGEKRMVVSNVPGTTRDSVDTILEKGAEKYRLIDTAGIRRKGKVTDKLEKFSILRALSSLEKCHVALFLLDAGDGITEQDAKIISYTVERGRACLIILNKWDLVKDDKKQQKWLMSEVERLTRFMGYAPVLTVSALSGSGVGKILPSVNKIYQQFSLEFTTNRLNRTLKKATDEHNPALYQGHRVKFYYATQIGSKPPTVVIFTNYLKGVTPAYERFLVGRFREELGMDQAPLRIVFRERERKKYG
ncbi:MAG: ribosome biogenesis GTPase Der [Desulfobulbaceae bacterium]|nr:ribosome biogenesis GTPase Der [Desulfobulbaceae bacterium]